MITESTYAIALEASMLAITFFFISVALFVGWKRIYQRGDYFFGVILPISILFLGLIIRTTAGLMLSPLPISMFVVPQYLAWATFLFLPIFLIGFSLIERKSKPVLSILSVFASVGLVLIAYQAFLIEPYNLEISRYQIDSSKIAEPVRIGVLSDIQTDNPGYFELEVFRSLKAEEPDLILMTGDYIQIRNKQAYPRVLTKLLDLMTEAGLGEIPIYAVGGDSEYYRTWDQVMSSHPGTSIILGEFGSLYEPKGLRIMPLSLNLSASTRSISNDVPTRFQIVFGHRPDFALGEIEADLLIAGHVHGGQVQLPLIGPLVTMTRVPKSWVNGDLIELGENKHLVVSRGIGMERADAPRMRFLCRPQLVIIDLMPES